MDMSEERVPEDARPDVDSDLPAAMSPLDPTESYDLHRAINERRAQVEDPEKLRHLRSL